MTSPAAAIRRQFRRSLEQSRCRVTPYRHWFLAEVLPAETCNGLTALPYTAPVVLETYGRRETNNASRTYFNPEARARAPVTDALARAFQDPETTGLIERHCGATLADSLLRIEYCQDTEGFWLEPHTDLGVKRFTLLIYLSRGPGSEEWGTDLLAGPDQPVGTAPAPFNGGLIFIPANDTWHAFHKRPIAGIRKSIIVNYVGPEWRSRHELSFPEQPVGGISR
jgi:hypothetical protein